MVNWNMNHAIASSTGASMTMSKTLPALQIPRCGGGCGEVGAPSEGIWAAAVGWPQFGQKRSPGLNSWPQFLQYLSFAVTPVPM